MKQRNAEILLAVVIGFRATSFLFNKLLLGSLDKFNMLGVRFLLAFLLLVLVFHRKLRHIQGKTILRGMIMGTLLFGTLSFELAALKTSDTGIISLLENSAIILVPIITAILGRHLPDKVHLLCAVGATIGVALLCGQGSATPIGVVFGICSCLTYAANIIFIDRFSHKDDSLLLGIVEVGFLGILAMTASFLTESPHLPQTPVQWAMILALAVVCTGFGFTLQPVAQAHTTAERASLFCAISPLVANILGAVVLKETITVSGGIGILLILTALILPNLIRKKEKSA